MKFTICYCFGASSNRFAIPVIKKVLKTRIAYGGKKSNYLTFNLKTI